LKLRCFYTIVSKPFFHGGASKIIFFISPGTRAYKNVDMPEKVFSEYPFSRQWRGGSLTLRNQHRQNPAKDKKDKCKAVPLQAWSVPEVSKKLRFSDFMTMAQDGGKVVSLKHRPPLPPGNAPGTHIC
jgi:hypothetical protein